MEDTTRSAKRIARDIVMSKTVEERILMCAEMYEDAKEFAKIGMPQGLTPEEQRSFIFRRIHGLTPTECILLN
ncbi:MAG TPA: hypothetical protein PKC65_09415 [Pyrinomonadaceae bacterium]|nr:hypothetical protein [Pyrinomonadaceae bacterium]